MQILTDYEGRAIRLTDERLEHIALRHPDVLEIENAIEDTLAAPDTMVPDELDPEVINYCRRYMGVHVDIWVKVVVAIKSDDAFILTAFTDDEIE